MTPKDASAYAREICGLAPVIPVIVVHDVAHAVPLAEALVAGGLPVLEVTLRTPAALEVIRAMAEVAGRRRRRRHAADPAPTCGRPRRPARSSASRPASPTSCVAACEAEELPLLGGIATVAEAMRMLDRGYDGLQVLPRRGERRRAGAQVLRRPAAADAASARPAASRRRTPPTTWRCRTCSASAAPGSAERGAPERAASGTRSKRLARDASQLER